jgi:ribonucleoside-diphosphate reductase alpha chain
MATSVIDYIFRDLAISYLKRTDLGQIKPDDLLATGTKNESAQSDEKRKAGEKFSVGFKPHNSATAPASGGQGKPSHGSADNPGAGSVGAAPRSLDGAGGGGPARGSGSVKAQAGGSFSGYSAYPGAVSPGYAAQPAASAASTQVLEQFRPEQSEVLKIAQARIKGYEGDPCPSCGSFTLIRNGTCMKCDTCGGTTGCS